LVRSWVPWLTQYFRSHIILLRVHNTHFGCLEGTKKAEIKLKGVWSLRRREFVSSEEQKFVKRELWSLKTREFVVCCLGERSLQKRAEAEIEAADLREAG
jgi:hypothetical protein